MLRATALRSMAFSLAKAGSIGFRSGLQGDRYANRALTFLAHAGPFVVGKVVHKDGVPGAEGRRQVLPLKGEENVAVHRAVVDQPGRSCRSLTRTDEGGGL